MDENAVMTMTARSGLEIRIARSVSMPLMPGSMTSRTIRSTSSVSRRLSASSPLAAERMSNPSRRSTASSTSRRTSSSSTMRMRIRSLDTAREPLYPWQRNTKLGALAGSAGDADLSVARVNQAAADGQSEARAALAALRGDERIEDSSENVGRDSLAVIADADGDAVFVVRHFDPDVPPLGHGIAGIEEDVRQNLLQVVEVPAHLRRLDVRVHAD